MRINRLHKTKLQKAVTWTYQNWPVVMGALVVVGLLVGLQMLPGPSRPRSLVRSIAAFPQRWQHPVIPEVPTTTLPPTPVVVAPPVQSSVPAAPIQTPSAQTIQPVSSSGDYSDAEAWAQSPVVVCIRQHESGDNYAEDTGNGYYGAYQDLLSTWQSHGGTGLPSDASSAVQVDLQAGVATGGEGRDTLISIEAVEGSAFADILLGTTDQSPWGTLPS